MSAIAQSLLPAGIAAAAAVLLAIAGGLATRTDAWYRRLRVPAWKPPDWAFGPIWALIFSLTAVSGVLAWDADASLAGRALLLWAFALNAALNVAWSVIFFRMRRPDWALAEVVLLWLSVALLVAVLGRASAPAALLTLPYLAWVGVAAFLNLRILRLNPGLGRAEPAEP